MVGQFIFYHRGYVSKKHYSYHYRNRHNGRDDIFLCHQSFFRSPARSCGPHSDDISWIQGRTGRILYCILHLFGCLSCGMGNYENAGSPLQQDHCKAFSRAIALKEHEHSSDIPSQSSAFMSSLVKSAEPMPTHSAPALIHSPILISSGFTPPLIRKRLRGMGAFRLLQMRGRPAGLQGITYKYHIRLPVHCLLL